jgi:hypothetical protein
MNRELDEFYGSLPIIKECSAGIEKYPKVYYIGKGKTGSSSLKMGIKGRVAHWHSTWFYEYVHAITSLTERNLTIYDFLEWIDLNIHPIKVIECYRDPIGQYISSLHQWEKYIHPDKLQNMLDVRYPQITFQKDIEKPDSHLEVIYLKTEDSDKWKDILAEHDLEYEPTFSLKNQNAHYTDNLKRIKTMKVFSERKLDYIYSHPKMVELYSQDEINNFKVKWGWTQE